MLGLLTSARVRAGRPCTRKLLERDLNELSPLAPLTGHIVVRITGATQPDDVKEFAFKPVGLPTTQ